MKTVEPSDGAHAVPTPFTPGDALLTCEKLVIGYDGKAILPPIDLTIRRGQFVAVVGRNGSGKSTWFRTLLGMQPPVSGTISRASAQVRSAYVPQTSAIDSLLPLRAGELTAWGRLRGWSFLWPFARKADRQAVQSALETAGAKAFAARPYRELSEGQKQRTLLARLVATEADLVLLDEPTAAMDAVAERETMQRLCTLSRERGLGVVVVCHDLEVAAEHADVLVFVDRETSAFVMGDARTVFCHPAFRRQYGDEYCHRAPLGPHRGNDAR
ncbi:metal ABC transporter ATP-binding protein [Myxococcus sp. SDU36]|uniref:metal ABC transporter ATP-binding protein n=1 Tax=Myxococcus sp. SDU36 TaxID=2831967 RepID=UPI0025436A86|nr:metal ABC transporter ATP-binding protein [Myxococcus sp. SDU36]WIG96578.1 metal ABC transporter ATP-binding protein [Myxococcus sp. SDU36]